MSVSRQLTLGETRLVTSVFGDGIDCAAVRIYRGAWWLLEGDAAASFRGRIYFPAKHYCDDFSRQPLHLQHWFIHEMTHVWQAQQGFPVLAAGVWLGLRGGYLRRRAYRYARHCVHGGFARMNMEQQADAVADYFVQVYSTGESELAGVLCDFLRCPHGKAVRPKFW